jgi:hypothetical protein
LKAGNKKKEFYAEGAEDTEGTEDTQGAEKRQEVREAVASGWWRVARNGKRAVENRKFKRGSSRHTQEVRR